MKYTKQEHEQFLKNKLEKLNQMGEFNIFCHKICISPSENAIKDKTVAQILLEKMDKIMNSPGLSLNSSEYYRGLNYGSINATAKFIEGGKNLDIENILSYDYPPHSDCVATVLIAIPKYLNVDGKDVEFSSTNGHSEIQNIENLSEHFKSNRVTTDRQHAKTTIYDALRSNSHIDKNLILGVQFLDKNADRYYFYNNDGHISKTEMSYNSFLEKAKEKLQNSISFYEAIDTKDLLVKTTRMHEKCNDDFYNEP